MTALHTQLALVANVLRNADCTVAERENAAHKLDMLVPKVRSVERALDEIAADAHEDELMRAPVAGRMAS